MTFIVKPESTLSAEDVKLPSNTRSHASEVLLSPIIGNGALKTCSKFTGEHPC